MAQTLPNLLNLPWTEKAGRGALVTLQRTAKKILYMGNIKYYLTIAVIAIIAVEVWARVRAAITPAAAK